MSQVLSQGVELHAKGAACVEVMGVSTVDVP